MKPQTEIKLSFDKLLKILHSDQESNATKIDCFNQSISSAPAIAVFLDPNIRILGQPLAHYLVEIGNLTALQLLLNSKPYLVNQILDIETGITLVHKACIYGHLNILNFLLLEKRAYLIPDRRGRHPIHCAVMHNHLPIVRFLIQASPALIELRRQEDGMTPLLIAAHEGHSDIVSWLLGHHADPYKVGKYPEFNLLSLISNANPALLARIMLDNSLHRPKLIHNVKVSDIETIVSLYNYTYCFVSNPSGNKKKLAAGLNWTMIVLNFLRESGCEDKEICFNFLTILVQSCRAHPVLYRKIIPAINKDNFYYQKLLLPLLQALFLKQSWEYSNGVKFALGWVFLQQSGFYLKAMPVLIKNPRLLPVNILRMIKVIGILLLNCIYEKIEALPMLMQLIDKKLSNQEEKSNSDQLSRYSVENHISILQTRQTAACSLQRPLTQTAFLRPREADLKNYTESRRISHLKQSFQEYINNPNQMVALLTKTGNLLYRNPTDNISTKTIDQALVDFNFQTMIYDHKLGLR